MASVTGVTTTPRGDAWTDLANAITLLTRGATDEVSPFHCEHDELTVNADPEHFSEAELAQLEEWGFHTNLDETPGHFYSFRYGSA